MLKLEDLLAQCSRTVWLKRLSMILFLGASLFLVQVLYRSTMSFLSDERASSFKPEIRVTMPAKQEMMTEIPQWHLFGLKEAQSATLPITSLRLQLVGIMHAFPEGESKVLISEMGQAPKVYRLEDSLSSGVRIVGITTTGVIVENSGQREKLPLPRAKLVFQGLPKKMAED